MHYGVEHIGHAHHLTEIIENAEYAQQADIGCETTLGPGFFPGHGGLCDIDVSVGLHYFQLC